MTFKLKAFLLIPFLSIVLVAYPQDATINNAKEALPSTGKIMIIPFEPKLYMSEIDQKINQQTKWNFEQIRENFRHQLDNQLKVKLKKIAPVISFYSDSIKMAKDLGLIYRTTSLSYDLVDKKDASATAPVQQKGIKNGQLSVEINTDKKFMNKKVHNTELLNYLNKKYNADYFVFINELDIKNDVNSYDIATDSYQREVTVHYTILNKESQPISAGISVSRFTSKENNPKKIVILALTPVATNIASKLSSCFPVQRTNATTK